MSPTLFLPLTPNPQPLSLKGRGEKEDADNLKVNSRGSWNRADPRLARFYEPRLKQL